MATAKEVITDALEDIGVVSAEEPLESDDGQVTKRGLNDMMTMWAAQGINLGFTIVSDLGDDITVADGALAGVKANLAIFIAPKFKADVTPSLVLKAKNGMDAILNLVVTPIGMEYPDILPKGSGNTYPGVYSDTFYTERNAEIVTETGGAIALEEDT